MIKSKALKKYYGRKAYADGYYGRIREYAIIEDIDGFRQEWSLFTCTDRVLRFEKVVIIDKLNFLTKNNVTIAIAVVDGRTFVGSAVLNPNDKTNNKILGRRLALARAMQDPDGEYYISDEISDMNWSDGNHIDEPDPIAYCDCCGEPIYEDSEHYETSDGHTACCEDCLHELDEVEKDNKKEEEIEPDGDKETEETEKHFFQADGRIIKGVDNLSPL